MAMSISKDINVVVRARRKELGLTQSQLAELAGVSSRFVFDLEAGKQTVSLDRVLLVLKVLGLKLNLRVSSDA
jgi:y4mF family transcriptional regulator